MFTRSNCPPSNHRRWFHYLAIPAAIAILPFSDTPIAHAQSVMCFEPGGLHVRDAAFDASYQTRALAEKLAKDGHYVLVKDCTTEEQTQDWYIYSSSPAFQSGYKAQTQMDVTKGLHLRVSAAKGKNIFTDDNLNFNLNYITEVGHRRFSLLRAN